MHFGLRGMFGRSALLFACCIIVAELAVVFTRTSWIGFLGDSPEWANAGLYAAAPLVAGASAFLSNDYLATETIDLLSVKRPRARIRVILSAWLRVFILAITAHAFVMSTCLLITAMFGASGSVPWIPVVLGAMPLAIACALGIAVSTVTPHWSGGVVAIVVAYFFGYLSVVNASIIPVNVGGATINIAGLRYDETSFFIAGAVTFVVVTCFLFSSVVALSSTTYLASVSVLSATVFFVILGGVVASGLVTTSKFTPSVVSYACDGDSPRVCVTEDHSARLSLISSRVRDAAEPLADIGVDLESIVLHEELSYPTPEVNGVLMLPHGKLNGIGLSPQDLTVTLLRPTNCDEYAVEEPTEDLDRLFEAARIVNDWIESKSGRGQELGSNVPMPSDSRIRTLYSGLKACVVSETDLANARP